MNNLIHRLAIVAFAIGLVLATSVTASAATWTVASVDELYLALDPQFGAVNGDTIVFDVSLSGQTLTLTGYELEVAYSVKIQGPAGGLTIDGNGARVFKVDSLASVAISG